MEKTSIIFLCTAIFAPNNELAKQFETNNKTTLQNKKKTQVPTS